ncbi:MAG TPA: NADH-quinone oxidoreductase subunit NuoK, partial [Nocardioidaceae bacterium]|nr:NADH-quinone oxidoreductase subunit NuoK [Nocardioidaceae bacterium]
MNLLLPLVVAALLFAIGVYGVLARRNAVLVLASVEIMLNAVNLSLVAFDAYWADTLHSGQVLTLF